MINRIEEKLEDAPVLAILSEFQDQSKWVEMTDTDLYFWIKVLNFLDELLEKQIDSKDFDKKTVMIVLRFLVNLIERAHAKTIFNSVDRVARLLAFKDEEIVLEALNVLIATIKQTHMKQKLTKVHENLEALRGAFFLSEGFNLGNPDRKSFIQLNQISKVEKFVFQQSTPEIKTIIVDRHHLDTVLASLDEIQKARLHFREFV